MSNVNVVSVWNEIDKQWVTFTDDLDGKPLQFDRTLQPDLLLKELDKALDYLDGVYNPQVSGSWYVDEITTIIFRDAQNTRMIAIIVWARST